MVRESCICNEGNPLSARESKGNPSSGLISNIVDHFYAVAFQNPYPIIILSILRTLYKPSYPLFDKYNLRDHNICSHFLSMHLPYKVNFSTANLLLNSYSKMCDTIIMFNLIKANLDVKMRPRPAADPHQQEKKTRKYYI